MDSPGFHNLDAVGFLQIWQRFDADDNGYIEGKELDDFFRHLMKKLGAEDDLSAGKVQKMKERFMSAYDVTADGKLQIQELANMILPEDENFLLLFRRETPLDNSVDFMRCYSYINPQHDFCQSETTNNHGILHMSKMQEALQELDLCYIGEVRIMFGSNSTPKIWRKYDADSSGYISATELRNFLRDLFLQHKKMISDDKLDEYTDTMMKFFDKNKDGRLDLNDLARILSLEENFLLQFKMDACSLEDRRKDFEKIFSHYDVSKTGALEGPEVDGFVKDMMELVKSSITGVDLDKFREILLRHCDVNKDGKIQKSELALCLGLKLNQ